jgi:hypothetical protein
LEVGGKDDRMYGNVTLKKVRLREISMIVGHYSMY